MVGSTRTFKAVSLHFIKFVKIKWNLIKDHFPCSSPLKIARSYGILFRFSLLQLDCLYFVSFSLSFFLYHTLKMSTPDLNNKPSFMRNKNDEFMKQRTFCSISIFMCEHIDVNGCVGFKQYKINVYLYINIEKFIVRMCRCIEMLWNYFEKWANTHKYSYTLSRTMVKSPSVNPF